MWWRRLIHRLKLLILSLIFLVIIAPNWPAFGDEAYQLEALVGLRQYDFLVWELQALAAKAQAVLARDQRYLDESTRRQIVLDYLDSIQEMNRLEWQIGQIYSNPDIADPDTVSADIQRELANMKVTTNQIQPFAEAILQDHVADVLREEQFALLEQTWPPVLMHMTPLPTILMVSPRDRIERIYGIPLVHGLTVPEQEALETAVFQELNLSALVVPIGGLGLYPSMIMESSSINWLAEVTAHEWAHVWMGPYPISLQYLTDPAVRTMNETTAAIAGKDIGPKVIARYYPEYVLSSPPASAPIPDPEPDSPPSFDFRAEMAETRVKTDELLLAGEIEAAEAYMETRRRLFVVNGFNIRKINQAYFSFYGAYADEPGAAGVDPIGPLVQEVRSLTPTLRAFLETMVPVNSIEELRTVVESLKAQS